MRWWGWGVDSQAMHLPESAQAMLESGLGAGERPPPRPALDDLRLPAPQLDAGLRVRLAQIVGEDGLRDDRLARVSHSAGRSYADLVRLRSGELPEAPDVVVYPGGHDQVRAVLALCSETGVAVVPFGGGTSVVGGVDPERGGFQGLVSLDLARTAALLDVDQLSLIARIEAGMT